MRCIGVDDVGEGKRLALRPMDLRDFLGGEDSGARAAKNSLSIVRVQL